MRKARNPFSAKQVLPRMSWHPQNLFNLYQRTLGPDKKDITFTKSSKPVQWQRFKSRSITRAYHGDWIQEKKFKRHYLPVSLLPLSSKYQPGSGVDSPESASSKKTPLSALMFQEIERRLDVVVFRSCFADSIYEARRMVIHGAVKLNGVKCNAAWTRLHPGDLVTVNPMAIPMLNPGKTWPAGFGQPYVVGKKPSSSPRVESEIQQDSPASSVSDLELKSGEPTSSEASVPEADEDGPQQPPPPLPPSTHTNADIKTQEPTPSTTDLNLAFTLPCYAAPFIFIPPYLEVSFRLCSTVYLRPPTSGPNYCEIPTPYDSDGELMRLSWEWYTRQGLGRRIRSWRREFDTIREMKIDPFSELHLRKDSVGGRVAVHGPYQGGRIGREVLGSGEPKLSPVSSS